MQIVIDISEEDYKIIKTQVTEGITNPLKICIANGTVLPKGHGRLKDVDHYIKMEWEHPDYSLIDDEPTVIEAYKEV